MNFAIKITKPRQKVKIEKIRVASRIGLPSA